MKIVAAILLVVAFSLPAHAIAKKGVEPSITLNETAPALGSSVTFTTTLPKLRSAWPMVAVLCYQSDALVYGELEAPADKFVLGGGSSTWIEVGGPADCVANLLAYDVTPTGETIVLLAATSFAAGG